MRTRDKQRRSPARRRRAYDEGQVLCHDSVDGCHAQAPDKVGRGHAAVARTCQRCVSYGIDRITRDRALGHTLCKGVGVTRVLFLSILCMPICCGCASKLKPIFEPLDPPIAWPAAPSPARIRYVGTIEKDKDLKPPSSFLENLGKVFVGEDPPEPLYGPRTVVCSRDGQRVWVADPGGRCLHLFDLEERVYTKIHRIGDIPLMSPVGLCLGDAESIYVCDSESGSIHQLSDRTGRLISTLRMDEDLSRPVALTYRAGADELYVVDVTAHNIKVLDRSGSLLRIIGQRGTGSGEFNFPCAITGNTDGFWIVDTGNQRIQKLTWSGEPIAAFGHAGDAPGDLALPKGVAVDSDGHVYVVDGRFENVQVFDGSGQLLLAFGEEGTGPGEFWLPSGIHIDATDRIWICDSYNRRIQVFDYVKESEPDSQAGLSAGD